MAASSAGSSQVSRTGDRRLTTETKQSSKTTELAAFVIVVIAILISAALIKGGDTGGVGDPPGGTDEFIARQAWLYVAIVTAAYMISRGLAKCASREPYTAEARHDTHDH
ncbi:MAG: hypothetical protein M3376_11370 [Actinomycetota bacterium]|nr:hypothetical protein [Actinomycetota bacterium]